MSYRASLGTRITVSILISFAWLAFLLLFLAVGTASLDLGATLAVLLISGLVAAGAIAGLWARWILKGRAPRGPHP